MSQQGPSVLKDIERSLELLKPRQKSEIVGVFFTHLPMPMMILGPENELVSVINQLENVPPIVTFRDVEQLTETKPPNEAREKLLADLARSMTEMFSVAKRYRKRNAAKPLALLEIKDAKLKRPKPVTAGISKRRINHYVPRGK